VAANNGASARRRRRPEKAGDFIGSNLGVKEVKRQNRKTFKRLIGKESFRKEGGRIKGLEDQRSKGIAAKKRERHPKMVSQVVVFFPFAPQIL
jgi:hypothetical protein